MKNIFSIFVLATLVGKICIAEELMFAIISKSGKVTWSTEDPNLTFLDKAQASCSANPVMCVMAGLTAAQIFMTFVSTTGAGKSAEMARCTGAFCSGGGGPLNNDTQQPGSHVGPTDLQNTAANQAAQSALKTLGGLGYSVDPNAGTVTTPSGKTVSGADMSSAAGMKAAGFSDADISKAQAIIADANKDYKKALAGFGGADGGGGGFNVKKTNVVDDSHGLDMKRLLAGMKNGSRGPASVEGLQKNLGADSIGVAGDNIFHMIHRCYQGQRQKGVFVP